MLSLDIRLCLCVCMCVCVCVCDRGERLPYNTLILSVIKHP
jgi:hypothetical protein